MKIDDFKADDQDTLEEKTKQNEQALKVSTSRNAVDVDGSGLNKEKDINGEFLDQDNAELKLDENFQKYREVQGEHNQLQMAFKKLMRFQVSRAHEVVLLIATMN